MIILRITVRRGLVAGAGLLLLCGMTLFVASLRPNLVGDIVLQSQRASITPSRVQASNGSHTTGKVHFDLLAKLLAEDRRAADPAEWLRQLADHGSALPIETQNHRLMGCRAPAFSLKNHRDQAWSLESHFAGRAVVLVFYLGYYCDACVHHLFELNADCARFQALGAEIVAVSGDSPAATREQFERFGGFQFTVLSDPEHAVARSYGTFQPATFAETEKVLHGTFVIGSDRLVQWAHCGEAPFRDVTALLAALAQRRDRSFAADSPLADHCPARGEP